MNTAIGRWAVNRLTLAPSRKSKKERCQAVGVEGHLPRFLVLSQKVQNNIFTVAFSEMRLSEGGRQTSQSWSTCMQYIVLCPTRLLGQWLS
jgi:hypothetical protein